MSTVRGQQIRDGTVAIAKLSFDVATQAELDAEAGLARNANNLASGTVADVRIAATIARKGLAGTKIYWVSDSNGGAVDRKLTFIDGVLTSET